ncbi:hypothetical protein TEA_016562 [Camellia sinensis var. sinensis]|uniref:PGG domain-containing protein n=1 Tax=Camellia sinensis var. sinensis TaxID=542762 RepID=A0A4S4D716_CAMSN|nr:hypothetical protein TEA_016562 [Camellia sinensis var. sinensis]
MGWHRLVFNTSMTCQYGYGKATLDKNITRRYDHGTAYVGTLLPRRYGHEWRTLASLGLHKRLPSGIRVETGSVFELANFSKWKETISIVATLIATVTFTAGITMPGGYIVDSKDPNQGMAILTRKAAFMAFVITDTIALTLSVLAVLTQLYNIADNPIVINKQIALAFILTTCALIAMLVAFITGTYAVLAPSRLSISVCVIPPILLYICLAYCSPKFRNTASLSLSHKGERRAANFGLEERLAGP